MSPFDQPPTSPPVSFDPPDGTGAEGPADPRRGRLAIIVLAAAGLVGGGIVVTGQLVSADDSEAGRDGLGASGRVPSADAAAVDVGSGPGGPGESDPADGVDGDSGAWSGQVVIDTGDDDPIVLDLSDVGEAARCLGLPFGGDVPARPGPGGLFDEDFEQRMEEFLEGLPWDDADDLPGDLGSWPGEWGLDGVLDDGVRIFGSGGSTVTIVGPDGVQVIDLGEGDSSVTIEQSDGSLAVTTDGDVTIEELPGLDELLPFDPEEWDLGEWMPALPPHLEEMFPLDPESMPRFEEMFPFDPESMPRFEEMFPFDPDGIADCLDELPPDD